MKKIAIIVALSLLIIGQAYSQSQQAEVKQQKKTSAQNELILLS